MKLLPLFDELSLNPKNAEELKGLILELAVKGKLTSSWRKKNPTKTRSEDLLDIINKGKIKLLVDSGVKKEKPIDEFNIEEVKFKLPKSWLWVRFTSIAYICRGGSPRPIKNYITDKPNGINWIKIGDTKGVLKYIEKCREKIIPEGLKKSRLVKPGDFILSNSMSFGKPYIMKTTGCIHDGWLLIREVKDALNKDYLYNMLSSPYVYSRFKDSAAGGVVQNLNIDKVRQILIPIPPLEEQKAIVETVKELLNEVEQLEALSKERIKLKEDFVESALNKLSSSEDTSQKWNYLVPHFKTFFTEKKSIKSLRETILQLAVQGKLTKKWREENPNVEPASELLERIEQEKQQLIEQKKIKKEKSLPQINDEDKPYKVPQSWVWCRMGNITAKLGAGSTPSGGKTAYLQEGIMFFRSQNIHNYYLKLQEVAYIPNAIHEKMKGSKVNPKDLLLNITGGSIGRCALIPDDFDTANVSQHVAIVRMIELETRKYIHQFIISPGFQDRIMEVQVGVSREGLSMTKLKLFPVPMPPLEEQKAIVEKVNSLMTLCDELEEQIIYSETQIELLMKSCLKEALEI